MTEALTANQALTEVANEATTTGNISMTIRQIRAFASKIAHEANEKQRTDFFSKWVGALNLTPTVSRLDEARTVNERQAATKRQHYDRAVS